MRYVRSIRRVLALALLVCLLAGASAVPAMAASKPKGGYVVMTTGVNIRTGASVAYKSLGKLPKGTVVVYKGKKNNWWKVQYYGGTGYVYKRYLTSVDLLYSKKYAATDNLWVHASASVNGALLGKLKKGLKVTLEKQKGTWGYINYKGRKGWVALKYLKKV